MSWTEFLSQIYWRPRIGDASFMGWLTVAAYGLTAVLCLMAALKQNAGWGGSKAAGVSRAEDRGARLQRRLWSAIAVLMAFLCVNKQLDLQSLLTNIGRIVANRGGWYAQRRTVQFWFVLAIALAGIAAIAFLVRKTRTLFQGRPLLLIGLSLLLLFVVMRAVSYHQVGVFLGKRILGLKLNWVLELGSIALVAVSAVQASHRPPEN